MNKLVKVLMLLIFLFPAVAFCNPVLLHGYQEQFFWADLSQKVEILKKAGSDRTVRDVIGQFYEYALLYVLHEDTILKTDPDVIQLIDVAVKGVENDGYRESIDTLWHLFLEYQETSAGSEILAAVGNLGKGNRLVIENLNHYLLEHNEYYSHGLKVNYPVVSACITAILESGDSSSYPALFGVLYSGYPEVIVSEATVALDMIQGDYKRFLFDVIANYPPAQKFTAFRTGMNSSRLSISERGELAEFALEQCLDYGDNEKDLSLSALRYAAVSALTALKWMRAGNLAVRHFYAEQTGYQNRTVFKDRYIEAIDCLGAIGNSNAAAALILQLAIINAQVAKAGFYDEEITLAIIRSLGLIGDKAAFDHLTHIGFLNYSEKIKATAREALGRLKW